MAIGNNDDVHLKLSEDLVIEILIRCSVKCLVCAKLVCKRWYARIVNNDFILNHLKHQKNNNKGQLLFEYSNKDDCRRLNVALFNDDRTTTTTQQLVSNKTYHDILKLYNARQVGMDGPVDGLFCLFNKYEPLIALWNPALMEFKIVPIPNSDFYPNNTIVGVNDMGFGTCSCSDHPLTPGHAYKLVLIRSFINYRIINSRCRKFVTLYNLTTNTWRLLYDSPLAYMDCCSSTHGSFLNGIYYWLFIITDFTTYERSVVMISFSLREEKFTKLPGPECGLHEEGYLTSYNDKLAFLFSDCDSYTSVHLWVMLEEGVWIHQYSLLTSLPPTYVLQCYVIRLWNSDAFFLWIADSPMVMINANTREMKYMGPKGYECMRVRLYFESMVKVDSACGATDKVIKRSSVSVNRISEFLCSNNPYMEMERPGVIF